MDDDHSYVEELMLPFTLIMFGTIFMIGITYVLMKAYRNWKYPEYVEAKKKRHAARALAKIEFVDIEILDPGDDPMGMGEFKEEVH